MPVSPSPASVHTSQKLTNISTAYIQSSSAFVAQDIFPVVPVNHKADSYWKYRKEDWFRIQAEKRAPATQSAGGGWDLEEGTYNCHVYAFHKDLDEQTKANADSMFNLDRSSTTFVTNALKRKQEQDFVNTYLALNVWGTDKVGGTDFLQWDIAGSDPIVQLKADILAVEEETGFRPNRFVIGPYVETALSDHPAILDRIKHTQRGQVTMDLVASLVATEAGSPFNIRVTRAIANTGIQGGTPSFSFMNRKAGLLVYAAPEPGLEVPTGGYTFQWKGLIGVGGAGIRMKKWYIDEIESDRIEGEMAYDMEVIGADLGVFYSGLVA